MGFRPGCTVKKSATIATLKERTLDVVLRHNDIQFGLQAFLEGRYGAKNVGAEQLLAVGTRVDIVVQRRKERIYYEIRLFSRASG
jgi:hypothetical protein